MAPLREMLVLELVAAILIQLPVYKMWRKTGQMLETLDPCRNSRRSSWFLSSPCHRDYHGHFGAAVGNYSL